MTKPELQLPREYYKLSPKTRRQVFEYLRWLRDVEGKERLRGGPKESSKVFKKIF